MTRLQNCDIIIPIEEKEKPLADRYDVALDLKDMIESGFSVNLKLVPEIPELKDNFLVEEHGRIYVVSVKEKSDVRT